MLKVKMLIAVSRHLPVYYTAMGDFSNTSKASYSPELPCIYLGRSSNPNIPFLTFIIVLIDC